MAVAIGGMLALDPVAFRESYGLPTERAAEALSEIRAPGGALVALGALMAVSCRTPGGRPFGLRVASATFLGYGLARVLSVVLDGVPSSGLLAAGAVELVFGIAALALARSEHARLRVQHHS
jgi:hypothetical protein